MEKISEFTIASLEEIEGEYKGKKTVQYKIKTSTGKSCYSNKGIWNRSWSEGMIVHAVVEEAKSANGNVYYKLKCPESEKPVVHQKNGTADLGPLMAELKDVNAGIKTIKFMLDMFYEEWKKEGKEVDSFPPVEEEGPEAEVDGTDEVPF